MPFLIVFQQYFFTVQPNHLLAVLLIVVDGVLLSQPLSSLHINVSVLFLRCPVLLVPLFVVVITISE